MSARDKLPTELGIVLNAISQPNWPSGTVKMYEVSLNIEVFSMNNSECQITITVDPNWVDRYPLNTP